MIVKIYYIQCLSCSHKVMLSSLKIDSLVPKMDFISDYAKRIFLEKFGNKFVCSSCNTRGNVDLMYETKKSTQTNNLKSKHKKNVPSMKKNIRKNPESRRVTCISCRKKISRTRLQINPNAIRCAACQSQMESSTGYIRRVNEGLSGTREGHKRIRGQVWSDVRNRRI